MDRALNNRWKFSSFLSRAHALTIVGRAYEIAEESAAYLPRGRLLDVGCGDGFVTYHLGALLRTTVYAVDILDSTDAPITFSQFDGVHLPFKDRQFDGALLSFVLHHSRDPKTLLREVGLAVRPGCPIVIYEDLPETGFDKLLC